MTNDIGCLILAVLGSFIGGFATGVWRGWEYRKHYEHLEQKENDDHARQSRY